MPLFCPLETEPFLFLLMSICPGYKAREGVGARTRGAGPKADAGPTDTACWHPCSPG